jgi:hypothetical protein
VFSANRRVCDRQSVATSHNGFLVGRYADYAMNEHSLISQKSNNASNRDRAADTVDL